MLEVIHKKILVHLRGVRIKKKEEIAVYVCVCIHVYFCKVKFHIRLNYLHDRYNII